ncbi:MAG: methyltransferase family protein [Promethearchaeota archaeon]
MVVKKDKIQALKKIHDNKIANIIFVVIWVILIVILIPLSPQRIFYGESMVFINIIGQILIILGFLNFIWLFLQKRGIGAQEMEKLLTNGAYGFCRHPIYLSHILIFFGLVFERGSLDALLLSPIIIIIYIITAKIEEEYSIGKIFKEEYEDYKKKTPMFLKWWIFLIISMIFIVYLLISFSLKLLDIQIESYL